MILVRDVFRLKYGQARPALQAFKEMKPLAQKNNFPLGRICTDLTGPAYTLVLESTFDNLGAFETFMKTGMNDEFRAWYQKFTPLVESGYREIFTIVE